MTEDALEPHAEDDRPDRRPPEAPPPAEPTELISRELLRIHEDSYGTGAHRVETHMVGDDYVLTVLDNDLTPAERTLLDAGHGESVRDTRMAFQAAIGSSFQAVVERATGRRVEAFVSHLHLSPMFTVELFRLAPADTAAELDEPV